MASGNTQAFYTFDAIESGIFSELMSSLQADDDDSSFKNLIKKNEEVSKRLDSEGLKQISSRSDLSWDDATLLWVLSSIRKADGSMESLDKGRAREKLGRYPSADGSPLTYLEDYLVQEDGSEIISLLSKLKGCLSEDHLGHSRFGNGFGGLELRGWLSADEVGALRQELQNSPWGVSSHELYDGGVMEVVKHLMVILRSAHSKGWGIVFRRHA
ncbi:MAG: hypothetical protein ACKVHH_07540 [Candidatus Poseidoniales archaeon]|jgi:hypothetical protein|tara:strand:- start:1210 stop:1851 length:642 start_codon:yes stop_codon:yes gene_type:complete